jgi:hypothetical protein
MISAMMDVKPRYCTMYMVVGKIEMKGGGRRMG